jgi:hypothetical protein
MIAIGYPDNHCEDSSSSTISVDTLADMDDWPEEMSLANDIGSATEVSNKYVMHLYHDERL